jgi:hypothetical protein
MTKLPDQPAITLLLALAEAIRTTGCLISGKNETLAFTD